MSAEQDGPEDYDGGAAEDVHDECGYTAAASGPVALVCRVERSYTTRSDIGFYASVAQAQAAAAHCRADRAVGHTIVAKGEHQQMHVLSLPGATAPTTHHRKGTP